MDDTAAGPEVVTMYGKAVRPGEFTEMIEIQRANEKKGAHFFDADTLRFFRSKVYPEIYAGALFITSEKDEEHPRRYSIRYAHPDGGTETVGEFQEWDTLGEARTEARRLARIIGGEG